MRMLWDLPLTWLLMPVKILALLLLWTVQQARNFYVPKNPRYWNQTTDPYTDTDLAEAAARLYGRAPVHVEDYINLYALRISPGIKPTGFNHNTDHMASRQGVWVGVLQELGFATPSKHAANVLRRCVHGMELFRGYHIVSGKPRNYNQQPVSGDMLIGFCMGYLYHPERMAPEMIALGWNLLEHKGLTNHGTISKRANFRPGINRSVAPVPVGAQDITYLCGLRCALHAAEKYGAVTNETNLLTKSLRREYRIRFWLYGGFLTCLMPTAGIWFKRGYNNDNVCIESGFILRQLVSNWFERTTFTCSVLWCWSLSWPWLNGYFTGLCMAATKGKAPGADYCRRAGRYAVDFSNTFTSVYISKESPAPYWPLDVTMRNAGEFLCDEDQEVARKAGGPKYQSVLGQLADIAYLRKWL